MSPYYFRFISTKASMIAGCLSILSSCGGLLDNTQEFRFPQKNKNVLAEPLPAIEITPENPLSSDDLVQNKQDPTPKSLPAHQTPLKDQTLTQQDFNLPAPENSYLSGKKSLWATYYYLAQVIAQKPHTPDSQPLLDSKGNPLGPWLKTKDWCHAAIEGSLYIMEGQNAHTTYNYASSNSIAKVNCSPYTHLGVGGTKFKVANGPLGDGVLNYKLQPWRTIAVDKNNISYGKVVYIPTARGNKIKLPDGTIKIHDGYFFAGDTGGAIKQNHIDVFIGATTTNPFPWVKSSADAVFEAYLVEEPQIIKILTAMHH